MKIIVINGNGNWLEYWEITLHSGENHQPSAGLSGRKVNECIMQFKMQTTQSIKTDQLDQIKPNKPNFALWGEPTAICRWKKS